MLRYEPPVFRPPSEAESLILQVTIGCSHNECTFCGMYRTKRFRAKRPDEVRAEIAEARRALGPGVARAFLADGDAMCLSAGRLADALDALGEAFPRLRRVGAYANARDLLRKSPQELEDLRRRKLGIVYLGLESGDDATLAAVAKGATAEEMIAAVQRARAAGMSTSVMVLVGVAGRERSLEHARRSAEAVNRMRPTFTALLTYTPVAGTPLGDRVTRGGLALPDARGSLEEIRELVRHLDAETHLSCNHASNWLALQGRMPSARAALLARLDAALAGRTPLRRGFLRGL